MTTSRAISEPSTASLHSAIAPALKDQVSAVLRDWREGRKIERLWNRDASLWTGEDESKWMGWLDIVGQQLANLAALEEAARDASAFRDVLLLGMGGSSLCPEVLQMTFGDQPGHPRLHVLDSTDPEQIKSFENKLDPHSTLFIVASKSGSTLEPNIFEQYFFEVTRTAVGDQAGEHFVAITDPGSKLEQTAKAKKFRGIFAGVPSVGGRYSALSNFGALPAAVMGLDVSQLLTRANRMVQACKVDVPEENPGVLLGVILGALGRAGRDKVTIVASPDLYDLGAWLEQLIAESTGKIGKGLVPVDREALGDPNVYGSDRIFVYVRLSTSPDATEDSGIKALESAGQPVIRINVSDVYDLGAEFFRWEIATAVAGSILGINPFNQPDVEASKMVTRELTSAYEKVGTLPAEAPIFQENGFKVFTDTGNAERLKVQGKSLKQILQAHLQQLSAGDYFALLAYVTMKAENETQLQKIRHMVRDKMKVATCLGFGPRFLHSTGQAYKGGPNTGVFLQITADDAADLPVPGQKYTFGTVKAAQARGDFQVLVERQRRALRIHLPAPVPAALQKLAGIVESAI